MFSALKQFLFPSPPPVEPAVRERAVAASRQRGGRAAGSAAARLSPADIDAAFYGMVLGVQSALDAGPNAFESRVTRELERLLAADISHSSLVPRLPAVIPRVMKTLRDESSSAAQLAADLGRDAVLVSEVIRLSNSPYYRTGNEITSLERAVFALGRTGIRQLVANAAFKPLINLNAGYFTRLSGTLLWEQSEKAAVACDCMARAERVDRFHAYLMAIVQNVGMTVALQVLDSNFKGSEVPRSQQFRERLVRQSRVLSLKIARQWEFPSPVLDALQAQIDVADGVRLSGLAAILHIADVVAKTHILSRCGRIADGEILAEVDLPELRLKAHLTDCYRRFSA